MELGGRKTEKEAIVATASLIAINGQQLSVGKMEAF